MNRKTRYFVIASLLVLTVGVGTGLVAYYVGFPTALRAAGSGRAAARPRQRRRRRLRERSRNHDLGPPRAHPPGHASPSRRPARVRRTPPASTSKPTSTASSPLSYRRPDGRFDGPRSGLFIAPGRFNQVKNRSADARARRQRGNYKGRRLFVAQHDGVGDVCSRSSSPVWWQSAAPPLVRAAIDRRDGGDSVRANDEIMGLVRSLDRGNVWAVGRFDALTSQANLPTADRQSVAADYLVRGQRARERRASGDVRMETRDEESAKQFRDVIRGFLALGQDAGRRAPELEQVMRSLQLGGSGKTVAVSFELPAAVLDVLSQASRRPARPVNRRNLPS